MNTTLLINLSGETYERIDIFEELPITLTLQQTDITSLDSRKVPFSKTIQIPDTSSNAQLFEHYYEVNGVEFNPLQKARCVVQYRGVDIFNGVLRLQKIVQTKNSRYYEVFILGEVADFFASFRDVNLQELNWNDLNHDLTYSAITTSWGAKADTNDGIFSGSVLYPLINYGLEYPTPSAVTPSVRYSFDEVNSFSFSGTPLLPKFFKPAVRLKSVLDRIFQTTDYTVVSEFFDTDYFRSIYMDTFTNGKLGVDPASGYTNQNIFKVVSEVQQIDYKPNQLYQFPFFDYSPGYDPLGNWQNYQNGLFSVPYQGDYYFNMRFNYLNTLPLQIQGNFTVVGYKSKDFNNISGGTIFFESDPFSLAGQVSQRSVNLFFSGASLSPDDFLGFYIKGGPAMIPGNAFSPQTIRFSKYSELGVTDQFMSIELYNAPSLAGQYTVDIKVGMPNLNCYDFIKGLVKMFNLLVIQDEVSKQVRFEPLTWYYDDPTRQVKDWTNILDTSQEYSVEPISYELKKELVWENTDTGFEYLNKLYFDQYNYQYGYQRFESTGNVLTGEDTFDTPFGSCPTENVPNAPNFIIPKFYYLNNGQETPYSSTPHLFFWNGNRYAYKDVNKTIQGSWYLFNGTSPIKQTTYPCVSHLSTLDIQIPELVSDLNFNSTFDFFGNANTQIVQFTPNNLYNLFWEPYITNLYDVGSRRLTGKFFLRPIDIAELELSDKIFVKDANYFIEKITDANLVNKTTTEVSLIKEVQPYYQTELPAPVYALSGNTPYPAVQPAFTTLCYTSTDKNLVCNSTAPLSGITTFGTGTIENFDIVYFNSGTQLVKLPMGTYIKQQSPIGADTFVVVDTYGRVLEQPC